MGIFSWIRQNWSGGKRGSLIDDQGAGSLRLKQIREAAADDVATIEQDDKDFSKDSPANEEDL